jgi:hypothetical protein
MRNNRIFLLVLIATLSFANLGASLPPASPTQPPGNEPFPFANLSRLIQEGGVKANEIIIKLEPTSDFSSVEQCSGFTSLNSREQIPALNTQVISVNPDLLLEMLTKFQQCPGVVYAEPNVMVHSSDTIPDDTYWSRQYGQVAIRSPQGWDFSTGSTSVILAVIDSGVDLSHPDLGGKIVAGYDFVNGDSTPQDDNGHGTHVAGIAAAVSNNNYGVAGVSWGARIMPLKILDSSGSGSSSDAATAIIWAADNGASVINMSFGSSSPASVMADAVNYAFSKGVTIVAASGNDGANEVYYPARYNHVIAVGATDSKNTRTYYSNYGNDLDLMAPGDGIYSTILGGFAYKSGTSMASPFVAGLAALLAGLPGGNSPENVEQAMESSALDLGSIGKDNYNGFGLIQMDSAIQKLLQNPDLVKVSPTNSANDQPTNLTMSWATIASAASYEYCMDMTDNAACDGTWINTGSLNTVNVNISSDTIYFWQVRALTNNANVYADGNTWWSFSTKGCSTLVTSVTPPGGGQVLIDPLPDCQDGTKFSDGTLVNLSAIPTSGIFRFINWSGDASGTSATTSIHISTELSVTANFEQSIFNDLPFDYSETIGGVSFPLYDHIAALYKAGFTAGCGIEPLIYCPETHLDRAMAAVFMLRGNFGLLYNPPAPPWNTFLADDWSINAYAQQWAEGMWNAELTAGCQTDPLKYCPDVILPRVQAVIFALHLKYDVVDLNGKLISSYFPPDATGLVFADMTDPFYYGTRWAEKAYQDGLLPICGTQDQKPLFCPEDPVDRAWAAYLIVKAKNLPLQ